jgi:hypothetical protein
MEREYDLARQVSGELEDYYDEAIALYRASQGKTT